MLAIDIGNTNITIGLFSDLRLAKKARMPTNHYSSHARVLRPLIDPALDQILISSVVPLALSRLMVSLNRLGGSNVKVVGRDVKVPVINRYRRKAEVGQDRLVNAFAARELYGAPAVIVDFGTAITFDILSKRGEYLGGLILPGIALGLRSLYENTALLPRVELRRSRDIIGKDTVSSMRGGILFGYGSLVDGLAAKYRDILGRSTKIISTGGDASLVKRYAGSIDIVDEDLTLKGLALLASK